MHGFPGELTTAANEFLHFKEAENIRDVLLADLFLLFLDPLFPHKPFPVLSSPVLLSIISIALRTPLFKRNVER